MWFNLAFFYLGDSKTSSRSCPKNRLHKTRLFNMCSSRLSRLMNLKAMLLITIGLIIASLALFSYFVEKKMLKLCWNYNRERIPKTDSIRIQISNTVGYNFTYTLIPRMNQDLTNNARLNLKGCIQLDKSITVNLTKPVFLANFVPIYEERYKTKRLIYNKRMPTKKEFEARLSELLGALQSNLNHPHIEQIFVFLEKESTLRYLHSLKLQNSQKLVLHLANKTVSLQTYFEYAAKCLSDRLVMIGHQDILFGKGWDRVNYKHMSKKKIMYAITRQPATTSCYYSQRASANCDKRFHNYVGSHDVFMFYVRKNTLTPQLLASMNFKQNDNGMENVVISIFKKRLNYMVSNPCPILHAHHQHCVPIRNMKRPRINNASTTGWESFTDKLV
ncbi:uncharacterized protein LOC130623498 [Hydractinia symbiolongicarpus]|uniref:uncharacterized protein LOC130623498 n=1 Tax=Hydractinia symbiolongicarpus TaxID=13093 RepID=UPI00254E0F98|nr:uncharacterized protein LOC130623498 [Hydractinia symbiolongicarpus]